MSFKADFFRNNRTSLRQSLNQDMPIVLSANGLLQKTRDDDAYPFKQESNFWYLTGLNEPDVILVMDGAGEYLILPERSKRFEIFSGKQDSKNLKKISGIDKIYSNTEGWEVLNKSFKKAKTIATLEPSPEYDELYDIYTNPAQRFMRNKIKSIKSGLKFVDLSKNLNRLRSIKQAPEIEALQKAIDYTSQLYAQISKNFANYKSENEIAADIASYQIKNQLALAFNPIVAAGRNAVTLHYQANNSPIDHSKITLLDIGLSYNNYCADITRDICLNPTKRHRQVYEAVLQIQKYAFSQLKPGVMPIDYERGVAKFAGEKLRELELIKRVNFKTTAKYFKHRTSHFLGIDVHDEGNYEKPFEAGMVITVEPGIYIENESIGVRIEDDAMITKDGIQNLSLALSKRIDSITIEA